MDPEHSKKLRIFALISNPKKMTEEGQDEKRQNNQKRTHETA
jgi:hypothetical protein